MNNLTTQKNLLLYVMRVVFFAYKYKWNLKQSLVHILSL